MAVPAMHDSPNSASKNQPSAPADARALVPASESFVPAWSPLHFIHPYTDALSNRVAMYFEFVKRKPKLVGVTSCSDGAGVSSIAEGLAAALSESGDGRILIVDMHRGQGSTQTFFQGKPVAESPQLLNGENLNGGSSDQITTAAIGEGGNRTLPTGLKHLLPKLKASDYDYIIFDMPKISMASMSLRLSALLDLTVLVVESEKVQSDLLKRNCAMLTESGAKVGVVMNKVHKYVPEWLHSEV
jgi:Mrp family chromosome partitioning ATPase